MSATSHGPNVGGANAKGVRSPATLLDILQLASNVLSARERWNGDEGFGEDAVSDAEVAFEGAVAEAHTDFPLQLAAYALGLRQASVDLLGVMETTSIGGDWFANSIIQAQLQQFRRVMRAEEQTV